MRKSTIEVVYKRKRNRDTLGEPVYPTVLEDETLIDGSVLLRLAHLYEVGEDKDLSKMATVDLRKLFPGKTISKITETTLSANQEISEMKKKRLKWKVEGNTRSETVVRGRPVDPSELLVELGPMEIRTFLLNFQYVQHQVVN